MNGRSNAKFRDELLALTDHQLDVLARVFADDDDGDDTVESHIGPGIAIDDDAIESHAGHSHFAVRR